MDRIKLDVRGVKLDIGRGEQGKQQQRQLHARFFAQFRERIRVLGENSTPVKYRALILILKNLYHHQCQKVMQMMLKQHILLKLLKTQPKCRPVIDSVVGPNNCRFEQASPVIKVRFEAEINFMFLQAVLFWIRKRRGQFGPQSRQSVKLFSSRWTHLQASVPRETHTENGGPVCLLAQLAGRWGPRN